MSVVLGPWYSVRVLIQYSVITFRATSMADTNIDAINPLNPELNPICYLLASLGAHHFLHVSRIRIN